MGLDMYLYKKEFVNPVKEDENKIIEWKNVFSKDEINSVELKEVSYIVLEVGYWRKVNAVHRWFVENIQHGVDNCATYYVNYAQLQELKELCLKALSDRDRAFEYLPPQSGFFFGSVEPDEWYFRGLEDTVKIISKLSPDGEYEYHSSW